jgi:hypothetical protein
MRRTASSSTCSPTRRTLPRRAGRGRRAALRLVPDDPRPAGEPSTASRSTPSSLRRRTRAAAGRARVQPQPRGCAAAAQRAQRRPLDARRGRRAERRGRPGRDAGPEARRPPAASTSPASCAKAASPACARWTGVDARQLLRAVPGRRDGRACRSATSAPSARRPRRASTTALSRVSEHHQRRHLGLDRQVQRVLDQVVRAVEFLFGFTLLAGLVVLFAAVTATREARAREFAMMRAMGASGACWRRCSAPSCWAWARWPACWPRWPPGGGLGAGALCLRVQLEPVALGAAAGRRAAGAGALLARCWRPVWWGRCARVLRRPVIDTGAQLRRFALLRTPLRRSARRTRFVRFAHCAQTLRRVARFERPDPRPRGAERRTPPPGDRLAL